MPVVTVFFALRAVVVDLALLRPLSDVRDVVTRFFSGAVYVTFFVGSVVALRETDVASRTAALATPTPMAMDVMYNNILLISIQVHCIKIYCFRQEKCAKKNRDCGFFI